MKKLLISLLAILPLLLLLPLDCYADKDKGPSDRAYDKANDNASFKRDDDDDDHKKKKDKEKHDSDDDDDDHKDKKNEKKKDK
jgi:hypothetical protein